jgi:ABC-type lipoprotein release transport system permease subunit
MNHYLSTEGLNLSRWSSAMSLMGISSIVHSSITLGQWAVSLLSAELAVIGASVWPAWRASRLKVVEAIQFQ